MGTSQTSNGAPSGVPMVPSWVPTLPPEIAQNPGGTPEPIGVPVLPELIAPAARFSGARRSLGTFASGGDTGSMRQGIGRFVASGYGGTATAVRRFGGTVVTAGSLYRALSGGGAGGAPDARLDPIALAGRSAREVIDAVIEVVKPVDGTQDAESGRASIRDALSELLKRFPDADLLNLTDEQRSFAIERYVASDVFCRIELDLGKTIIEKAPSKVTACARLKQIKNYVKETVAASFRQVMSGGLALAANQVERIVRDSLRVTFQVFQGYAE